MNTLRELEAGALRGSPRVAIAEGLESVPKALRTLTDSLEILDLSRNRIGSLPDWFAEFRSLRILFLSQNEFREYPRILAECPQLEMVGLKSNKIEVIPSGALSPRLRWLILTDNLLEQLPSDIGGCTRLQKAMLAGNRLRSLPASMSGCASIELIRLAANELEVLPDWLLKLPKLAWIALASNRWNGSLGSRRSEELASDPRPVVSWEEIELGEVLGEGASGATYAARLEPPGETGSEVAVKVFKGAITSDGFAEAEISASLAAGAHPHLLSAFARVIKHPNGKNVILLPKAGASFSALAGPPSFVTCTRDVYPEERLFSPVVAARIASGVLSALVHLHSGGILHGDLYAHNVLVDPHGNSLLGDFGAASSIVELLPEQREQLQRIELRAFGILLAEVFQRTKPPSPQMSNLARELMSDSHPYQAILQRAKLALAEV